MAEPLAHPDSFTDEQEPKSSKVVWDALCDAERDMGPYFDFCDRIDRIIDAAGDMAGGKSFYFSDQEFDLFWSSLEIMKPAVYSRAPQPVVSPRFQDRDKVATTASELLERCLVSSFERGDFDQVMLNVRDDLIASARGVPRVTYEDDTESGKRVCDDHVDRRDFLHEPARKWSEVGWVGFASYLTEREFKKRFPKAPVEQAEFNVRRTLEDKASTDTFAKCKVWEVWHKADKRVYWVTSGVDTFLDEQAPFLSLEGFYPCPRPAFGSLKRRSLVPVPDYVRYERTLEQINDTTRRIHGLLDWVRLRGFFAGGGDVGNAAESILSQNDDDVLLIPVPAAALMQGGAANVVQWLPLQELAATITGLIEARRELINNYYELSGISDIMRGATEAEETLGAQQLKSQYGSVRVRMKIDELQRVARDVARITAEIIAEKFDQATLLDMAQMTIPTKAEIKEQMKKLEAAAKRELDGLEKQAREAAEKAQGSGQQINPQQMEQQFQQQQQAILEKFRPQIEQVSSQVAIEDVMKLLRDQKARAFSIDIETDSTIMVDEMAEKAARAEFLNAFAAASQAVQPLLALGEAGAKLAGAMIKFALAPFRAGRELDGMIDDFVDAAPQAIAQQQGDNSAEQAMAEANQKLADAEMTKAQAAVAGVQAKSQLDQAENQRKIAELQVKAQADKAKADQETAKLQLQLADMQSKGGKLQAEIDNLTAQTAKILASIGLDERKQQLSEYTAATNVQAKQVDQAMSAQDQQLRAVDGEHNRQMGERQQDFSEQSSDRQMNLAERQAERDKVE